MDSFKSQLFFCDGVWLSEIGEISSWQSLSFKLKIVRPGFSANSNLSLGSRQVAYFRFVRASM
jgi:hypothetical protein